MTAIRRRRSTGRKVCAEWRPNTLFIRKKLPPSSFYSHNHKAVPASPRTDERRAGISPSLLSVENGRSRRFQKERKLPIARRFGLRKQIPRIQDGYEARRRRGEGMIVAEWKESDVSDCSFSVLRPDVRLLRLISPALIRVLLLLSQFSGH